MTHCAEQSRSARESDEETEDSLKGGGNGRRDDVPGLVRDRNTGSRCGVVRPLLRLRQSWTEHFLFNFVNFLLLLCGV